MRLLIVAACWVISAAGVYTSWQRQPADRAARTRTKTGAMDKVAEEYVKLVLALGQHDADYVDAYYGPTAWKTAAETTKVGLDVIAARAHDLIAELGRERQPSEEMQSLRLQYLQRQLSALAARVRILKGERLSFDEESRALYDAVAPTHPESHFQEILDRLAKRFPGNGPLVGRYEAFRREFVIPHDKLTAE